MFVSALALLPPALARLLVRPKPEERGLAQLLVARPLGVSHLRDELRRDPRRVLHLARGGRERAGVPLEQVELLEKSEEDLVGEARPDGAAVAEHLPVEQPDEGPPEVQARPLGEREAADHELGLATRLHLQPAQRTPAGLVARREVLADDALPALLHGLRESGDSVAPEARLEPGPALGERAREEGASVRLEAVEEHEQRPLRAGLVPLLQEPEARDAARVEDDHLAVHDEGPARERRDGPRDLRLLAREVETPAREERHPAAAARGDDAPAVVLRLEDPAGSRERHVHARREHRGGRGHGRKILSSRGRRRLEGHAKRLLTLYPTHQTALPARTHEPGTPPPTLFRGTDALPMAGDRRPRRHGDRLQGAGSGPRRRRRHQGPVSRLGDRRPAAPPALQARDQSQPEDQAPERGAH